MAPPENALTDLRAEWVQETTVGQPPSDPEWNTIADYFAAYPGWSGDAGVESLMAVGRGDVIIHSRGPEEHQLTLEYWLQQFWVDGSGNTQDLGAVPMTHDYQNDYPSFSVVMRNEAAEGGNADGGIRMYFVMLGARPTTVDLPGDPATGEPIAQELGFEVEKGRGYVIHQPSSSTTLDVVSSDSDDTMDITIESEDASTNETITLSGTTTVTTTSSFADIDAAYLGAEPQGDVTITDGSGNTLLELTGKNSNNVEGDRGVPTLGSGSHDSAIGTDPEEYVFNGTESTYDGGKFALSSPTAEDRVHALDLSVEVETAVENRQGTGRPVIDIGPRTAQADVDVAGPYESIAQNREYFATNAADIVYTFPNGDITLYNAYRTDTDDVDKESGDENLIYGVTFEAEGDPALDLTYTA